jgi:transposase
MSVKTNGRSCVVERSFAWLGNSRRLSKDYERRTDTEEVFVKISEVHRLCAGFICFLNTS